jgi:hypothetical protein
MGKTYKDQKDNKVNHAGWDFTSKRLGGYPSYNSANKKKTIRKERMQHKELILEEISNL